jgi:hypothetical protein
VQKTLTELLDIATRHTPGEEAVGTIFAQGSGKVGPSGRRGALPKAVSKGAKRSATDGMRGPKWLPQRVMVTTSCDDDDNDKEVNDSYEEHVAVVEHNFKHQAR